MGTCFIASLIGCNYCEEDNHIGHQIFRRIPTQLEMTGNQNVDQLMLQGIEILKKSEQVRQEVEKSFENMFMKTGACVLRQPTIERAILSSMIHFLILLIQATQKVNSTKTLSDYGINFSSVFKFTTTTPFLTINDAKLSEMKKELGFIPSDSWIESKDSIIACLGSIMKFSEMYEEYKVQFKIIFTSIMDNYKTSNFCEASMNSIKQVKEALKAMEGIELIGEIIKEIINACNSLTQVVTNPSKFREFIQLAEDAIKKNHLEPMEIVFVYSNGKKCEMIHQWKENMCFRETSDTFSY